MAEKLVNVDDVLFDETCYAEIASEEQANAYVRYFSKNVATFRMQLMNRGWKEKDINRLIDTLWERVIRGCLKYGVPLTPEAEVNAKRLKLM